MATSSSGSCDATFWNRVPAGWRGETLAFVEVLALVLGHPDTELVGVNEDTPTQADDAAVEPVLHSPEDRPAEASLGEEVRIALGELPHTQ